MSSNLWHSVKAKWRYAAEDVVGAIEIGLNSTAIAGSKQAALDSVNQICGMFADRLTVKETALASVALFDDRHANADELRFIGQHLNEAGMRNAHKVLVGTLAQVDVLLPAVILADDQIADTLSHEAVN